MSENWKADSPGQWMRGPKTDDEYFETTIESVVRHKHQVGEQYRCVWWGEGVWAEILEIRPDRYLVKIIGDNNPTTSLEPIDRLDAQNAVHWRVKPQPIPEMWINHYDDGRAYIYYNSHSATDARTGVHFVGTLHVKPDGTVEWVTL